LGFGAFFLFLFETWKKKLLLITNSLTWIVQLCCMSSVRLLVVASNNSLCTVMIIVVRIRMSAPIIVVGRLFVAVYIVLLRLRVMMLGIIVCICSLLRSECCVLINIAAIMPIHISFVMSWVHGITNMWAQLIV